MLKMLYYRCLLLALTLRNGKEEATARFKGMALRYAQYPLPTQEDIDILNDVRERGEARAATDLADRVLPWLDQWPEWLWERHPKEDFALVLARAKVQAVQK